MASTSLDFHICLLVLPVFGDQGFPAIEIWLDEAQSAWLWISQLMVLELSDVFARSQIRGDRSTDQIAGMRWMLSEFGKDRLGLLEPTAVPLCCVVQMRCTWLMWDPMSVPLKRLP